MKGFTLVELLIVIGITIILASASAPIYGRLQVSAQLNESTAQIIQNLRTARERSVAGVNNSPHGVYFGFSSYTLYQGSSYLSRDPAYDRTETLDSALSLTYDIADGDVNFSQNKGEVGNIGTIVLHHTVAGTRSVVVNRFGIVEEE